MPLELFSAIQSTWLQEALADLDPSCSKITITIAPPSEHGDGNGEGENEYRIPRRKKLSAREKAGIFKLETMGNFGQTEVSRIYLPVCRLDSCHLLINIVGSSAGLPQRQGRYGRIPVQRTSAV